MALGFRRLLLDCLATFLIAFLIRFQVGQWAATLAILRYLPTLLKILNRSSFENSLYKLPNEIVDLDDED